MSHMVIYRGSDGKPGYHQTDDIHDAVGFVEQMRNDQGVEHARIFRLEEVVFQYRPYYRVELAESGFGELSGVADAATDITIDSGSGTGTPSGSMNGELSIIANGGDTDPTNGANGSSDSPATAVTGSASSSSADDGGGAKRGLFGR